MLDKPLPNNSPPSDGLEKELKNLHAFMKEQTWRESLFAANTNSGKWLEIAVESGANCVPSQVFHPLERMLHVLENHKNGKLESKDAWNLLHRIGTSASSDANKKRETNSEIPQALRDFYDKIRDCSTASDLLKSLSGSQPLDGNSRRPSR